MRRAKIVRSRPPLRSSYSLTSCMPTLVKSNSPAPTSPAITSGGFGSIAATLCPTHSTAILFDSSASPRSSKMLTETTRPLPVVQRVVGLETRRFLDDGNETFIYSAQQLIRQAWDQLAAAYRYLHALTPFRCFPKQATMLLGLIMAHGQFWRSSLAVTSITSLLYPATRSKHTLGAPSIRKRGNLG